MSLPAAPAGWRDVESSVGCPIASTNLLLCKAPLSETRYKVAPKFAFTPKQLIEGEAALGRRVAFIVEVSVRTEADRSSGVGPTMETSQFYDPITELQPHGVRFVHSKIDLTTTPPASSTSDPTQIPCPITDESIQRFVQLIRGLVAATDRETAQQKKKMEEPKDNAPAASSTSSSVSTASLQPYIYIHDIYGYNLVGFLVACYLVEECGMDVITAVNDVADSRPPGIYISSLFQSLVNRYFPGEQASCAPEDVQPIPIIPDLPRPDFHQLPWTGIAAKPATATATNGVGGDEKANETDGVPGETFKRKARKKPTPAPAPVPILSSTAPASMISTPAPTSLSSAVASVAGVKRSLDGGVDDSSTKRTKLEPSSKPSIAPISTFDAASLRRDHPFLIALRPIQVEKLTPILTSLLPQSDITALRAGANIWSLLTPPPLTSTILSHMLNTSSPGHLPPYSLSWIPRHVPCFMLLQRTDVYLIFSPTDWFQVPQLYFPKRKAPNECVNNTLLLGELILDPCPSPASSSSSSSSSSSRSFQSRFLANDLLVMSQTVLSRMFTLDKRLQTLELELIAPIKQLRHQQLTDSNQHSHGGVTHLHIRCKMMFPIAKVESVFNMKVEHGNLGLVIQMNGKQHDEKERFNEGYKFLYQLDEPNGIHRSEMMKLALLK